MRIYSKSELQQFDGYDVLKQIYNDGEIQVFYNTPKKQRGQLLANRSVVSKSKPEQNTLTLTPPKQLVTATINEGTQMCTVSAVRNMALQLMDKDFEYRGRIFNMNLMGWAFSFNDKKRALGTCYYNSKEIQLSSWIIENSDETIGKFRNTILHEIAHAIDSILGYYSKHGYQWKLIAKHIGCNPKSSTTVSYQSRDLLKNPISKYTFVCEKGHTFVSHKKQANHKMFSCPTCGIKNKFDERYLLKQIKNW